MVTNSEIRNNSYGVYAYGDLTAANNPAPVVTNGAIYNSTYYNYQGVNFGNAANTVLDATNNWWGTTNFDTIHSKIFDQIDNGNAPWVEIGVVLDTLGGSPFKQLLHVPITADMTLTAGLTYSLGRAVPVAGGATLTIEAGTRIEGHNSSGKLERD